MLYIFFFDKVIANGLINQRNSFEFILFRAFIVILLSYLSAALSYKFLEKPILDLKRYFSYSADILPTEFLGNVPANAAEEL
jgi:peptidoglycan/LPS O-acetylase OafA/YrhL